ncbi:unnamed protein product [Cochlearia groenlandica]
MTLSILVEVTFLSWPPPDPASASVPQPTSESPMMLPLQPSEPPDPPDPPDPEVTPGPEDTMEIALARSEVKDMLSKSQCKVIILQHIGFAMDMLSTLEDLFLGKMLLSSSFCLFFASKASYFQDFHALICIMCLLLCSKLRVLGTHIYLCNMNI